MVTAFMYISALVQIYTYPPPIKAARLQSVEEIAKKPNVHCGYIGAGSTASFFKASKVNTYEMINEKALKVASTAEGLERVRDDPKFALFMESPALDYELQRQPCDLYKVGGNLNSVGYGLAFPRTAIRLGRGDMLDSVNMALLELRERGTIQVLYKKHWYDRGECGKDSSSSAGQIKRIGIARPLNVYQYSGAVIMLVLGLIMSAAVGAVEVVVRKRGPQVWPFQYKDHLSRSWWRHDLEYISKLVSLCTPSRVLVVQTVKQTIELPAIWDIMVLLWRHNNIMTYGGCETILSL